MTKPTGKETPPLQFGLPEDEYFTRRSRICASTAKRIILYHEPKAHTDGDSVVLFRGSDVVSTGDIFTPGGYPFIDLERGGSIQGEIDALDHILDSPFPGRRRKAELT